VVIVDLRVKRSPVVALLVTIVVVLVANIAIRQWASASTSDQPIDHVAYAEAENVALDTACAKPGDCWHDVPGLSFVPACATGNVVGTVSGQLRGGAVWIRFELEGPPAAGAPGDTFLAPPALKFGKGTHSASFVGTLSSSIDDPPTDRREFTLEQMPITGAPVFTGTITLVYAQGSCV
jgi:hypothetical protein